MTNNAYRKDISGLRAIAVLLVIFYHVGFGSVSGGFVGVDVFFVLSGFLITLMVYKEVSADRFSYKQFYMRRVRRLIPVLLVVLIVSCLVFWFFLLPDDYYLLTNSAGASFLSISNFYFKNITSGYWGADSQNLPLIHTWSLSVEEQFYIIWPTTLVAIQKFLPKHFHKYLILSLVIILLIFSEYQSRYYPNAAYYLLPARAYELLLGALLALTINSAPKINHKINHLISIVGLAGIVTMSFTLQKGDVFPGINAAVVCFATLCLLFAGKDQNNLGIINKMLSHSIMVYIGLISYSLYLWHWPVIAFFNYLSIEKTFLIQLSIIILTFLASILSYHGVEQFFRVKIIFSANKTFFYFLGMPFIFFLALVLLTKHYEGFPKRFSNENNNKISIVLSKKFEDCPLVYCDHDLKNQFINKYNNSDFLLIGDSHAGSMEGFLNSLANDADKKGALIVNGGNPFLIGIEEIDKKSGEYSNFSKKNKKIQKIIENFKGDTVVLTARYSKYTDRNNESYFLNKGDTLSYEQSVLSFQASMLHTIDFILSLNKKLIIIEDVPYFPIDKSKCTLLKSLTPLDSLCSNSERLEVIANFQKIETTFFTDIKSKYPELTFINTRSLLCDDTYCSTQLGEVTLYRDHGHLNYIGSKLLGDLFLQNHPNPLKK